ncbi:hypothetical protein H6F89_30260 [Cyanobacteria bacterium FACHB-63]|nr:hypothetical protein [Cyanobacteria bacterium FACHB-63]
MLPSLLTSQFQEIIYQHCLISELQRTGKSFVREQEQTVYYSGIHVVTRRVDFATKK